MNYAEQLRFDSRFDRSSILWKLSLGSNLNPILSAVDERLIKRYRRIRMITNPLFRKSCGWPASLTKGELERDGRWIAKDWICSLPAPYRYDKDWDDEGRASHERGIQALQKRCEGLEQQLLVERALRGQAAEQQAQVHVERHHLVGERDEEEEKERSAAAQRCVELLQQQQERIHALQQEVNAAATEYEQLERLLERADAAIDHFKVRNIQLQAEKRQLHEQVERAIEERNREGARRMAAQQRFSTSWQHGEEPGEEQAWHPEDERKEEMDISGGFLW